MKKQLIILWIGIGIVILSILFPPWAVKSGGVQHFLGYGFLFCPPLDVASIEWSRLTAEILIIVLLAAGAFYTAKVSPLSIQITQKMRNGLKLVIAVLVGVGVVTFIGVLLKIHVQAKKAQPMPAPQTNAQQAIGNQPAIPTTLSRQMTEIHHRASEGNLTAVEKCLQQGDSLNVMDLDGNTPLILAAANGHLDVVKFLVGEGANVNTKSIYNATALILARNGGHQDVVEFLILQARR